MTTPTTVPAELPEALLHASYLESAFISEEMSSSRANRIAACLRRLHAQVEALSAAQAGVPADDFQPCASCFGKGVEGDADDYGRTIDVTCGECNGSGRAAAPQPSPSPAPATWTPEMIANMHELADALPRIGGEPTPAPAKSNCMECSNADSWGLPDKPCCRSCVSGSHWEPLNKSSVNQNVPAPAPAQPGQEGELQPCPCGATPTALQITGDEQAKWAHVSGNCCGTWEVEYRNNYAKLVSHEAMAAAKAAWNDADRAARAAPQPATADAVDAERWRELASMVEEIHGGDDVMTIELSADARPAPHLKSLLEFKFDDLAAQREVKP